MDCTPERAAPAERVTFAVEPDENRSPRRSSRVKKNPSVTPKRFTKFFTPRPRNAQRAVRTSRKALQNLSAASLNSRSHASGFLDLPLDDQNNRARKKRKLSFSSIPSIPSSPIKKDHSAFSSSQENSQSGQRQPPADNNEHASGCVDTDEEEDTEEELPGSRSFPPRLIPYRSISSSANLLSRRIEGRKTMTEGNDSNLWQHETANFYSSPDDLCHYNRFGPLSALPFSAAGFKTVPLVAIGDEEGTVRIHDAEDPSIPYNRIFMTMYPHDNAIMDMELSPDDSLLATASGDQTCRIIDMKQQQSTYTLRGHVGSIKRVQFQPGSGNNVLATCSRDGSICLWDLRCAKTTGSWVHKNLSREPESFLCQSATVDCLNQIRDAHTAFDLHGKAKGKRKQTPVSARSDFAVTTCAFISASRPYMLATASENDAIIKLWDMRTSYKSRSGRPTPVSATLEPKSHEDHRQFGVTSIAMSTDGARLYSLCRDHTVYAYSTSHLVLGGAPEMSLTSSHPFRQSRSAGHGLGPLYGFRHPALRLASFYDKLSVRHRTEDNTEIIATGTREECAVLFPTDERYLNKATRRRTPQVLVSRSANASSRPEPRLTRTASSRSLGQQQQQQQQPMEAIDGDCPIYYHGTALVNGHAKEVTAVAWTVNGNLITTADDYTSRCWREDAQQASSLRLNTDRDLVRYQSGWAEVRKGYDDDEAE
ncbi:hypothetical protein A1O1_09165 [Capronia coronata CBS 617.96]|uniref:Uncharacterized protein n=1 Tax=Capronia coronata CBS 617.96 TaxID=1182541 RepID=W9XEV6_9EURO|nr:uncharacterized protein A1O1_09165 [Capronia coronata CBS 617.96]EXJ78763.1 hypothetical protein A1O1_09165 [Capronia coronata CBS 617.96]